MGATRDAPFQDLLLRYSREPDAGARGDIEAELWRRYGVERAVLVLDMSGFSQLTARFGLVHYLSMVLRMQLTAEPIVRSFDGTLVKFEADNCYAMFSDVPDAIDAAIALDAAFARANLDTPEELDIRISCGIDHGPILLIEGEDFFGHPVNRACKLGEDLAHPGEILITREAMRRVPGERALEWTALQFAVSGIEIEACSLAHPGAPRSTDAARSGGRS